MTLALVASRMNFIQSSVRIWSLCRLSKLALSHIAASFSPRSRFLPSSSPNTMRMKVPVCLMRPGAPMVAEICATPPIT